MPREYHLILKLSTPWNNLDIISNDLRSYFNNISSSFIILLQRSHDNENWTMLLMFKKYVRKSVFSLAEIVLIQN